MWRVVWLPRLMAISGLGLIGACFEDTTPSSDCPPGERGCPCTAQEQCFRPLVCELNTCREYNDGTDSATSSISTTQVTDPSIVSTSSGSTDPGSLSLATTTDSTTEAITTADSTQTSRADEGSTGGSTSEPSSGSSDSAESSSTGNQPVPHLLFVTSDRWSGGFVDSIESASAQCQTLGDNTRVWRAILSDSQTLAENHIQINAPVLNMKGDVIANDAMEFWSGIALANPGFDEAGQPINPSDLAWVGNLNNHCHNWSASFPAAIGMPGYPTQADVWLSTGNPIACSVQLHLYCISQ